MASRLTAAAYQAGKGDFCFEIQASHFEAKKAICELYDDLVPSRMTDHLAYVSQQQQNGLSKEQRLQKVCLSWVYCKFGLRDVCPA